MRLSGKLKSWNDDRGFGFIAPTQGSADVFLHISELPRDGSRPTVGEKLTYEMGQGKNGRPQAVNVIRQAFGDTRHLKRVAQRQPARESSRLSKAIVLVLLLAIGAYGYRHYVEKVSRYAPDLLVAPTPIVRVPVQETTPTSTPTSITTTALICDGRRYCSQMTSCSEAKYFLQHCPGTEMDGDNDGTPCEQQWCTSPFAK